MPIVFFLFIMALLGSVTAGLPLAYPLSAGLAAFWGLALLQGFTLRQTMQMVAGGIRGTVLILEFFLLIGLITAAWRSCGTVAYLVYYGVQFIWAPCYFLCAFWLTSLFSFLLGTSIGTAGTMGIILMVLSQGFGADPLLTGGAILSGCYFGDRCSAMSSSCNLVALLTRTQIQTNITNMLRSGLPAFLLSSFLYLLLSLWMPPTGSHFALMSHLAEGFVLSPWTMLPALLVLAGAFTRIPVKICMLSSIVLSVLLAVFVQHQSWFSVLQALFTGYQPQIQLPGMELMAGGGILSMKMAGFIVLISSAFAGLFAGTNLLSPAVRLLEKTSRRWGCYPALLLTSIVTAAFTCNQTLAVILSHQFHEPIYRHRGLPPDTLALDLENTAIMIPALLPWNIAAAIPISLLSVSPLLLIFAFYLYLIPLTGRLWPARPRT